MSMTLTILIGGVTLFLAFLFRAIKRNQRPEGFPPGPMPLPLLGNLHQIGLEPWKTFMTIGKKYGGVFGIDYGSYRSVVLNDIKSLKQYLAHPAFSGRPKFQFFFDKSGPGSKIVRGITFAELQQWTQQRRFCHRNLRDFGFGKSSSMESVIQEEVHDCIKALRKIAGKPIKTHGLFNAAVLNALWRIMSGSRTPHDDPRLQKLLKTVLETFEHFTPLVLFFPVIIKYFPEMSGYNKCVAGYRALYKFVEEDYNVHKESMVPGQPRDLIDAMIDEIAETTDPTSSFYGKEGEMNVINTLFDVFLGGVETAATQLNWLLLTLSLFPEIQDKISEEIQREIGPSREIELADRAKLPYTECCLLEIIRFAPILPLGVMHSVTEDVHIGDYFIPKDTVVNTNLYGVLHDEAIWGDPAIYRPERFLLPNGTVNYNHEGYIPFSYGKRICMGEKLAKDELFLFATGILQHFRVTTNPNGKKPTLKATPTIVVSPEPHELILHERL